MPTRKWGSEQLVGAVTSGVQTNAQVAGLPGGGYVVVWQDGSGANSAIRAQAFDAKGEATGTEMAFAANGVDFINPSVAAMADGTFYITCTQRVGTDNYILGAIWDTSGALIRSQTVVFALGLDDQSDVAAYGTGSIVSWTDPNGVGGGDIDYRVFDAAGNGGAVLVANVNTAGNQIASSVATSPGGRVAFAYFTDSPDSTQDAILVKVYRSTGFTNATEFRIDPAGSNIALGSSSITWLNAYDFVITWDSFSGNLATGGPTIFAQIYRTGSAGSGPISSLLQVNTTPGTNIGKPDVTALPNGGFVITWVSESYSGDDLDRSIRLQAFDAAGGKIGGEQLVNTTTSSIQDWPSVSALSDGRVVVSWTDSSTDAGDIRTQIIDPRDGLVNGTASGDTLYGHDSVGDQISGFGGADILYGLNGDDSLYGGQAADLAFGGGGDDTAFGGSGDDDLRGGKGDDTLNGEGGDDTLRGGDGADDLSGGAGIDTADYSDAVNGVTASLDGSLAGKGLAAGDTFSGIENLVGSGFADTLSGDGADNMISGGAGKDSIDGKDGNDILVGGSGADSLTGGAGNDTFRFDTTSDGKDSITDFQSSVAGGGDILAFSGAAFGGLPAGAILDIQFQSSVAATAKTPEVRFIYETDTGILRFDADGNGAGASVAIATLQPGATLAAADIIIF